MIAAMGAWGWGMRRVMMDYNHWATIGVLGEILPWEDNRVELADEKDQYGLPVAKVTFNLHDNDKKLIEFGKSKVTEIMWAAGAKQVVQESRFAHLVGDRANGKRSVNICCRQVWPNPRHSQSIHLRWQCSANPRLRKSRTDHPGARGANGGLSDSSKAMRFFSQIVAIMTNRQFATISARRTQGSKAIHELPGESAFSWRRERRQ